MANDIAHKLDVFISSTCGGKYTISRKALKRLLENTGLISTYVFETEPGSSEDTQSAYLEYVDSSSLCVFLIDNKDGVRPAVLSEINRAKDKGIRQIYVFCDENSKEPTLIQEEIRNNLSQKYCVAHEFADVALMAYDSVMQDIIAIYKSKNDNSSRKLIENSASVVKEEGLIETGIYSLSKTNLVVSNGLIRTISNGLFHTTETQPHENETFDDLLAYHIRYILRMELFDICKFELLCNHIISKQETSILDLLRTRFEAQKQYYNANYVECFDSLKTALNQGIENESIPAWMANDIAIDMRNVESKIAERKNDYSYNFYGQKYLDEGNEPLYYPYLDRCVQNFQEKLTEEYLREYTDSPYTTRIGGIDTIFDDIAKAFITAIMHGSITQTEMLRSRLISLYLFIYQFTNWNQLNVELIRLLIINREKSKLENMVRTGNRFNELINYNDVDKILESINVLVDPVNKLTSKYLLVRFFGYNMGDNSYKNVSSELLNEAMKWVYNDNGFVALSRFIFDCFENNILRLDNNRIIDFVFAIFNNGFERYYIDCFRVIRHFDFSKLTKDRQEQILSILNNICLGKINCFVEQNYMGTITRFCKSTTIDYKELEVNLASKHEDYYKHTFLLEVPVQDEITARKHIEYFLELANKTNESQGKNGAYSMYMIDDYKVIYNIIYFDKVPLEESLISEIIDSVINALLSDTQIVTTKISAMELLQLLYYRYRTLNKWNDIFSQMVENENTYSTGREMFFGYKDTNRNLSLCYYLFVSSFDKKYEDSFIKILYQREEDSYNVIKNLEIIERYLISAGTLSISDKLLYAFLYYSISYLYDKERDIVVYATNCLLKLTKYESTINVATPYLLVLMENGSSTAKRTIISSINDASIDNKYIQQIINQGKADNDYCVRYFAERKQMQILSKDDD